MIKKLLNIIFGYGDKAVALRCESIVVNEVLSATRAQYTSVERLRNAIHTWHAIRITNKQLAYTLQLASNKLNVHFTIRDNIIRWTN